MPADLERARDFSRIIFGGMYRLEVAAAIAATDGDFYTKELADKIGIDKNLVHQEVKKLLEAGLLKRLPKVPGQQPKYLEREDSPFWRMAAYVYADLAGVTGKATGSLG